MFNATEPALCLRGSGIVPISPLRVLIVEPDTSMLLRLLQTLGPVLRTSVAAADTSSCFLEARKRVFQYKYDRIVANLRLRDYNGLHLVYLADTTTRSIIYTAQRDIALAREVHASGACYEWYDRLRYSLRSYVVNRLPPRDRRSSMCETRREVFRGGRRASDVRAVRMRVLSRQPS